MSITAVTMPKLGMAMTEGTVAKWLKDAGAQVTEGEEIVDIETDKVTNAYEAPESGVLKRIIVPVGETLNVGALIAVICPPDTSDAEIDDFISNFTAKAMA